MSRATSKQLLKIFKGRDSIASLGNLCQCSISLTVKTCFLTFTLNFMCSSLCSLPLAFALGITEESLALASWHTPFKYLDIGKSPPKGRLLQAKQPQLFQPLLTGEMLHPLYWTLSNMSTSFLYLGAQNTQTENQTRSCDLDRISVFFSLFLVPVQHDLSKRKANISSLQKNCNWAPKFFPGFQSLAVGTAFSS